MGKFLEQFKFEVILFVAGTLSVIALAILKHNQKIELTDEFEICLATAVALIPVTLARLESLIRENREMLATELKKIYLGETETLSKNIKQHAEVVDRVLRHCEDVADHTLLTIQLRNLAASAGFVSLLERVSQQGANCSASVEQIVESVRDIGDGRYPIVKADQVYLHDAHRIDLLNASDFYWATWSANANPESFIDQTKESVAFTVYTKAQKSAAARGVEVVRLYILPSIDNLPDMLKKHLRDMKRSGIQVRLVEARNLNGTDKCEDFVIIGKHVVGIGEPARGPMQRSVYFFNFKGTVRTEYREYSDFFKDLRTASREYAD